MLYEIAVGWKDGSRPTRYTLPTGTTESAAIEQWAELVELAKDGEKASTVGLLATDKGFARVVSVREF